MAIYGAAIASPPLHPSLSHLSFAHKHRSIRHPFLSRLAVSCQLGGGQPSQDDNDDAEKNKRKINVLELLKLSATVTIITASLPQKAALAAARKTASSSEKKKRASSSAPKKQQEALTPDQYNSWAKDLPVVTERLACTDLFDLKSEGKLKHIIKPPLSVLGHRPEVVLAVLDDSRVFRTVLPSMEGNPLFWARWDELGFNSLCVNAYTPPVKKPEVPSPYLGFLSGVPRWMLSTVKSKVYQTKKKPSELQIAKEEMKRKRLEELERMDNERKMLAMAVQTEKKMEQRKLKQLKRELKMQRARELWNEFAQGTGGRAPGERARRVFSKDSPLEFAIAMVLFALFYKFVILGYKQQLKDYDDRIKIEKAEAEERKRMRALDREMAGLDPFGDDEEEGQGGAGENNPLQIARNFVKSGAKVRRAKLKRTPQFLDKTADVKFSDVAGIGRIRIELEEIVKFFTEGDVFRKRGVKIPGGILLSGPPGVGKTLLAKAVAGEAGVNFLSISASQFVEIYVGVGASRVRALYEEAKELAPAVVFIDELDAVGRKRGLIKGSGGQERDATLNQLLVCLDGFQGRGNVITIASTNRPDILDPALVRPGRFDRKIEIPKPSYTGRMEILKVHARNKPVDEDVDYSAVARESDGMSGAQLANVIEIAALYAMRDGRPKITTDDLIQAAHIEDKGLLDKKERSPEMWRKMALNEVAPAVAAINFDEFKNVEFITIAPRAGRQLGYFRYKQDDKRTNFNLRSLQTYLDYITMQLASRAADELFNGEDQLSTVSAEGTDEARSAARTLVLSCLTDKHYGMTNLLAVRKMNDLDLEAQRILLECYERSKEIMRKNRKLLEVLVEELAEKKSLTKEEFFHFANQYAVLEPPPPSVQELREQYRKSFKENMISEQSQPKQLQ